MNDWSKLTLYLVFNFSITIMQAQDKVLSPEKMQRLIPDRINGFYHDDEIKGRLIKVGNLQYSLCEHRFWKGKQTIIILLFDYNDAQIMYIQATKAWTEYTPIVSDSIILRSVDTMTNCIGLESYRKDSNMSQIYLGIYDRFFFSITGEGVDLEALKVVLSQIDFEKFPKKRIR